MPSNKYLLFSVGPKNLKVQYFRAGGKGGQKQNKTSSACRIVHPESGAIGESREERSQHQNKMIAFRRLIESQKFKVWAKLRAAVAMQGYINIEQKINDLMDDRNLKVEYVHTFTCDVCKKSAEIIGEELPEGWFAEAEYNKHLCKYCKEREARK